MGGEGMRACVHVRMPVCVRCLPACMHASVRLFVRLSPLCMSVWLHFRLSVCRGGDTVWGHSGPARGRRLTTTLDWWTDRHTPHPIHKRRIAGLASLRRASAELGCESAAWCDARREAGAGRGL